MDFDAKKRERLHNRSRGKFQLLHMKEWKGRIMLRYSLNIVYFKSIILTIKKPEPYFLVFSAVKNETVRS